MKVVILAGGFGSRLSEETYTVPKPMVQIGDRPILWHIMKIYSSYGFNDFIICLGYKGYVIKEYFANYFLHQSDVTINLKNNEVKIHKIKSEPWKVTLVDTGIDAMTGGRIKKIMPYIDETTFMLTYGDGVADIDIKKLLAFHNKHKKIATLTAIQPVGKFGSVEISAKGKVASFREKQDNACAWVNGGFFVLNKAVFDYIPADDKIFWEQEPLQLLAADSELMSFQHTGFWKSMDTLRDKNELEELWNSGKAPWKVWKD